MVCWQESSVVQAFMQKNNLTTTTELRNYFEIEVQNIVNNANKRAIVWEEVPLPARPFSLDAPPLVLFVSGLFSHSLSPGV